MSYLYKSENKNYIGPCIRYHTNRRRESEIFQVLREKTHQPRILYPVKLSFKSEEEIKTFSDKQKLKEFVASKPALQ